LSNVVIARVTMALERLEKARKVEITFNDNQTLSQPGLT
jgi:hypothetical protein